MTSVSKTSDDAKSDDETIDGETAAAVFDMDGVVTDTAEAHFAAWKATFDETLARCAAGDVARPFEKNDYYAHVDGMPRRNGIRRFLAARGLDLPEGTRGEPRPDTLEGIAAAKNARFLSRLAERPVPAYPDALALIRALKARGIAVGLFTASRNAARVLDSAGVADLFDATVDGVVAAAERLPGKPDPAVPIACARRLGAEPGWTILFEDATAGIAAGRSGGFRRVVGVDREPAGETAHAEALRRAGADIVVRDLRVLIEEETSP